MEVSHGETWRQKGAFAVDNDLILFDYLWEKQSIRSEYASSAFLAPSLTKGSTSMPHGSYLIPHVRRLFIEERINSCIVTGANHRFLIHHLQLPPDQLALFTLQMPPSRSTLPSFSRTSSTPFTNSPSSNGNPPGSTIRIIPWILAARIAP